MLIAYTLDDAAEWPLEPAPLTRDWMEANQRFAYRCLPLTMANQAGWIIRSPASFWVRSVGEKPHQVRFTFAHGDERFAANIRGVFGQHIVTFCLPYLFRTEPGVALRVSGPPNFAIGGACPLEGIVETEWLPFTFTMNWQLTPYATSSFCEGDPIAFLQPVRLDVIENARPELRRLADEPELAARFAAWQAQREELVETQQSDPTLWDAAYTRGAKRTRLNLPEFK